ncbi:MAG: DMT family transporter [Burkholderiales bacterium]|nr:DMT family transporter [Burkholderiales bacterium]
MHHRLPLLAGLAVIAVWGLNFPLQKAILGQVSPLANVGTRYFITPVCALLLMLWRYGWHWPRLSPEELRPLGVVAVVGQVLHLVFAAWGMQHSTAFSASVLLAVGPVFTLLILRASGVEHLGRAQIAGVAVACAGALAFTGDKLLQLQWQASFGDLVLLLAAALFSYYTVASKPLIAHHGGVVMLCYGTFAATLPALLLTSPALLSLDWAAVPNWVWWGQLWQVAGGGFLGWLAWGWANERNGVAPTAPLIYLMPVVAGFASWLWAGEQFGAAKLLGAGVVLGGVALAQFGARR